jgi:pimeloyl-ACP methyl ester carboxylesterase
VLDWLKEQGVTKVAVWGRSMGAATSLMHMSEYPDSIISCAVLDSGFARFKKIVDNLMGQMGIPEEMKMMA